MVPVICYIRSYMRRTYHFVYSSKRSCSPKFYFPLDFSAITCDESTRATQTCDNKRPSSTSNRIRRSLYIRHARILIFCREDRSRFSDLQTGYSGFTWEFERTQPRLENCWHSFSRSSIHKFLTFVTGVSADGEVTIQVYILIKEVCEAYLQARREFGERERFAYTLDEKTLHRLSGDGLRFQSFLCSRTLLSWSSYIRYGGVCVTKVRFSTPMSHRWNNLYEARETTFRFLCEN